MPLSDAPRPEHRKERAALWSIAASAGITWPKQISIVHIEPCSRTTGVLPEPPEPWTS